MASGWDATVIGGGIFGLSCAWEMARRGARIRVIEAARVGAGASGGVVGALAPHAPERWTPLKAFQRDALLAAEDFWGAVEAASGVATGYARTGRLQPVADAGALERAEERAAVAALVWQRRAAWRVVDAGGRDWAPASTTGQLVEDTLSARVNPTGSCEALAAALRGAGAEIREGETPEIDQPGPVLWATGAAGLRELSTAFGREVGRGVKGQAALLALDRPGAPQLYTDGLHVVPHADGTVAIGSTTERDYDDPEATDGLLDDVVARARAAVPALGDAPVVRRWAGLRPRARSRAPVLGVWPDREGHFVANGGFKIGFGLAPGVARVMADLILEGRDAIPPGCQVEDSLAAKRAGGPDGPAGWQRIETLDAFLWAFADRPLHGEGVRFTIHSTGRVSGVVGSAPLTGNWWWADGLFCRRAWLGDEDLGPDCETIEARGVEMRYRRDGGRGEAIVVSMKPPEG